MNAAESDSLSIAAPGGNAGGGGGGGEGRERREEIESRRSPLSESSAAEAPGVEVPASSASPFVLPFVAPPFEWLPLATSRRSREALSVEEEAEEEVKEEEEVSPMVAGTAVAVCDVAELKERPQEARRRGGGGGCRERDCVPEFC